MALQNIVEPECGEGNPVIKLSHHINKAKVHREELFTSWNIPHSYNVEQGYEGHFTHEQLIEDFLYQAKPTAMPQTFNMGAILQEMQEIEAVPPIVNAASEAETWASEYLNSAKYIGEMLPADHWTKDFLELEETCVQIDPEAIWDEAVKSATDVQSKPSVDPQMTQAADDLVRSIDDPELKGTEFMTYVKQLASSDGGRWMVDGGRWADELSEEIEAKSLLPKHLQWEREFEKEQKTEGIDIKSASVNAGDKDQFWSNLQESWLKAAAESKESEHPWLSGFEEDCINPFKDYEFETENPLKDHPDPLAEGKKCLERGDLPSAILLFEAAAQREPSCSEAWLLLGTAHAENEQDPSAIAALKRGVALDPLNLNGWMSLATSYTNESYQNYACEALKEWIRHNEQFKHLLNNSDKQLQHPKLLVATLAPRELVEEVQGLYLKAVNSSSQGFSSEAQCGLGILMNLTGDYEKAIDCFQMALKANPKDARLWNKLGATMANSDHSAEAIEAYRKALELSPGFIRCRYNLGVACINLGAHREAVEHFLEALHMQGGSKGPSLVVSDNIWSTLRLCLRPLNAQHLIPAVQNRDLEHLTQYFGSSGRRTQSHSN